MTNTNRRTNRNNRNRDNSQLTLMKASATGGTARNRRARGRNENTRKRSSRVERFNYKLFNLGVGIDLPLVIIVITLICFGLLMLFSASFSKAYYESGDSYAYIRPQAIFAGIGFVAMLAISYVDYHLFYKFAWLIYGVAIALLLVVLVDTFALSEGVAQRWIEIGSFSFQPSEIGKFAVVVIIAYLLSKNQNKLTSLRDTVIPTFVCAGLIAGLILAERHLSGFVITVTLAIIVMFVGGIQVRWFVILGGIGVAIALILVFTTPVFDYIDERLIGWLDPFATDLPDDVDPYQTIQSLYAIGSGQLFGVGLGQSIQKHSYLPAAQNDFIFSIVCEELGFIGGMIVILLFIALMWRGIVISINAKDKFGMLLGLGMTATVGIQAAYNICVVTNAFPNTGISLPFFSYGGTAMLVTCGMMGVLLSVSRNSYTEKL